jgi:hypothetical protein
MRIISTDNNVVARADHDMIRAEDRSDEVRK